MSDTRLDFGLILTDHFELCDAVDMLAEVPSCRSGWDGEFDVSDEWRFFYLYMFLPPEEASRAIRGVLAVRRFFRELHQALYEKTGQARPLPEALITELGRRVLVAMHPSNLELALGATSHPANMVSQALVALDVTEAKWQKRYS